MGTPHPLKTYRDNQEPPLTQKQLADLLGVARETVARWESGSRKIDDEKLSGITERTGIPARELRPDLVGLAEEILREPQAEVAAE